MNEFTINQQRQWGLTQSHLQAYVQDEREFLLAPEAMTALLRLRHEALKDGFDLQIVSAFRGYQRQLMIWQAKATGRRALLDMHGEVLDFHALTEQQRLCAILRWSAIPGLSRHHWGSDVDVFDASAMHIEDVQLIPAEVNKGGACAALHEWLDVRIQKNQSFGFYRPFALDKGGVAPERWHLSYLPLAKQYIPDNCCDSLLELWRESDLAFLALLEAQWASIFDRFVDLSTEKQPDWVVSSLAF